YAADEGQAASDNDGEDLSLFTKHLIKELDKHDETLCPLFERLLTPHRGMCNFHSSMTASLATSYSIGQQPQNCTISPRLASQRRGPQFKAATIRMTMQLFSRRNCRTENILR